MKITTDSLEFLYPFTVGYFENQFDVSGRVDYDGELDLEIDGDLTNLDRWRGKLFLDQPGGRGTAHARLAGATNDPDLIADFVSDSIWLYGLYAPRCKGSLNIRRFLSGRQGFVEVELFDGDLWSTPFDTALARLSLDSLLVYMDSVYVGSPNLAASASGTYDYGTYPAQIDIDSLQLDLFERAFFNRGTVDIAVDSSGFDFRKATIGRSNGHRGTIAVTGKIGYDESMVLNLQADSIPMAPWAKLISDDWPVDGFISATTSLGGRFASPVINLSGRVDSLTYQELKLGDLSVAAHYADRQLTIDSAHVVSKAGDYYADGFLNIDLTMIADSLERIPNQPMDLHFTANDTRFDLVSLLLPTVEQLDGDFHGDVRLSGTPESPHLEGFAYIKDARLKYFDLADLFYSDSAGVRMQDNRILIDGIEAYVWPNQKKRSYVSIEGELEVRSLENLVYDIDVNIPRQMPYRYELEDIEGTVEGEMNIVGETPPKVTGNLIVGRTRYRVPFAEPEEGSPILAALTREDSWDLDLNIDILSNYWIKNADIDAEFAGQINLIRTRGEYRFIGEMEILRGRGFLFDKTPRLQSGSRVIFEDIEYPNPRLDITARIRIPGVRFEEDDTRESIELDILVTGTLDTVEINTAPESGFSREDILPLIAFNYYSSDTGGSDGAIQSRFSQLVGSQVSQIGTRQLAGIGVETFEIDPAYDGQFNLGRSRVMVGMYLPSSNVYVYGRSGIATGNTQEYGFEYRFSRQLMVEGKRSETDEYFLNLKLHWEF
ncbi:MAG: translocation/assembly module TamB domain-containing protein, partial [candidate division Zixibacteria bacterium]